jgi:hypothetical protein
MSCKELAVLFMKWATEYHVGKSATHVYNSETIGHYKTALKQLVLQFGNIPVNDFRPLDLITLQKYWTTHGIRKNGYARKSINQFIGIIKQAFKHAVKFGYADSSVYHAILTVDNLKKGKTTAPEYRDVKPVDLEIVKLTLPFMPPIIADMVKIQFYCNMRGQDVRNMRSCDIDFNKYPGVWVYTPFTHKNSNKGKTLQKAIPIPAQEILKPYLNKNPDEFLFSPKDSIALKNIERRQGRKSLNKKGEVQPSHVNRKKDNPKRTPGSQYSRSSYNRAINIPLPDRNSTYCAL